MLGELLDKIEETLNEQGQGKRDGAVNIIVGNSGTVIIGDGNSPNTNNDGAISERVMASIAPAIRQEVRRLRHQVQSLKRLVTRIYRRRTSRPFKRPATTTASCRVSIGAFWDRVKLVANHRPPDQRPPNRPTPAVSLTPARINPPQPTLTRMFHSFCPHTFTYCSR